MTRATASGSWRSTSAAIASAGPITSQGVPKPVGEQAVELAEQMDVLGFLAGEVEQGADAMVVAVQLRPGMVEHERQDELLDQAEQARYSWPRIWLRMRALRLAEEGDGGGPGQRLRA